MEWKVHCRVRNVPEWKVQVCIKEGALELFKELQYKGREECSKMGCGIRQGIINLWIEE